MISWDAISSITSIIKSIGLSDYIDIFIVAMMFYYVLKFISNTKSYQLVGFIIAFVGAYVISAALKLRTLLFILNTFLQIGLLAVVIIFQPEIRRAISELSNNVLFKNILAKKNGTGYEQTDKIRKAIVGICDGVERMSEKQTGALIVMENFTSIEGVKSTGTAVDAEISAELLGTIFYEGSPLHDGAVVISDNRISYAGCVLPLSENFEISKDLGTRHRAALGLSEHSDAVCIVVSEETGIISVAFNKELKRPLNRETLYDMLTKEFLTPLLEAQNKQKKSFLRRLKDENK